MSENTHNHSSENGEHGTVVSYLIGFMLSLFLTVIPYYIVVNKVVTGNKLLVTILGFAFVQMLVQIFFFLHLGRGPKPLYNVLFFVATVGLIVVAVGGSIFIMNNLYRNMSPYDVTLKLSENEGIAQVGNIKTGACQGLNKNHKVVIKTGKVTPVLTEAHLCDTLTFINEDGQEILLVFGPKSYGGEFDKRVNKVKPMSITLNELGTYSFTDSKDPSVSGFFVVTEHK